MSQVLRTAAIIVAEVVGSYLGGPPGAAIATALVVATEALAFPIKPPKQIVNPMSWQADPQAGIDYVMGRAYWAGKIVYRQAFGKDDVNETINTALSFGPIQSIDTMYVDGVATGITSGGQAQIHDYGKMYVGTQLGRQPEPGQLGGTNNPGITTASKLSGLAATTITLSYDTKGGKTLTTEPQVGWLLHGVKVYDPRLDSSYPGGSGPQRAGDETTWTWSENPYLHGLSYLIGRRQNGKLVIGVGAPLATIRVDEFVEGANIADANGWKIGGVLSSTDDKWQRLKDILQAGGGEPLRLGAQIGCLIDTPRVSLATLGTADVVGSASVQATQARRDRINAVVPRYMAEQSITTYDSSTGANVTTSTWGMVAGSPVVVPSYVALDGRQRQKEIEYGFVSSLTQSQQLARYDIENAREFGPIVLPLKLRWMGYKPGDVVTATLPELGLVNQDILILSRTLSPHNGTVTITARSETAAKHAFALGQTGTAPPTPSISGAALVSTPAATEWAVTATTIANAGHTVPALVVTGAADTTGIDGIVFELRAASGTLGDDDGWQAAGTEAPATTSKAIVTVSPGVSYQVSVRYVRRGNTGGRLILGPVNAGADSASDQAVAALAQAATAGTSATSALAQLNVIGSDGYLSRGEKPAVIQDWSAIFNEAGPLNLQAQSFGFDGANPGGSSGNLAIANFNTARDALGGYLTGLTPAWDDVTQDTAIVGATFRGKFTDYYFAKIGLLSAIDAKAATVATWDGVYGTGKDSLIAQAASAASKATSALAQLGIVASDGYLSRGEKSQVIADWGAIYNEAAALDAQATALGVDHSMLDTTRTALASYLTSLTPAWDDVTQDTAIVGATFRGRFTDYYFARAVTINAMANAAAQAIPAANRVKLSQFEAGVRGWAVRYNPAGLAVSGLRSALQNGQYYFGAYFAATAAGQVVSLGTSYDPRYAIPVNSGERLAVSAWVSGYGPIANRSIAAYFTDASGAGVSGGGTIATSSAAGDYANSDSLLGGFVTVPPTAVRMAIDCYVTSSGAGNLDTTIAKPMVCAVSSAQTVLPVFVAGPNADDGADVTGQNTANDVYNVNGTPSATVLANISAANALAGTATSTAAIGAQLAADVADNGKFSSTEKKRWVEKINALDAAVQAEITQANTLGLGIPAYNLGVKYGALKDYLDSVGYSDVGHTSSINSGTFKAKVKDFTDADTLVANAARAYAQNLSIETTANIWTDPSFGRLSVSGGSSGEYTQVTLANGSHVEASGDGQRLRLEGGSGQNVVKTASIPVSAGDRIDVQADAFLGGTSGGYLHHWAAFLDGNGAFLSNVLLTDFTALTQAVWNLNVPGSVTAPSNAASCELWVETSHTAGTFYFRNPRGTKIPTALQYVGANGRQSDGRLVRVYTIQGSAQVSGLTASVTASTITLSGFSVDFGNGFTSITGSTVSGLAASTTYYMWILAPDLSDSTHSIVVSTSFTYSASRDRLYLGSVTTQAAAGTGGDVGGSGGATGGAGSGGHDTFCVVEDNFLSADLLVGDAAPGSPVDLACAETASTAPGCVRHTERALVRCVRLIANGGAAIDCSIDTPLERADGTRFFAGHAPGELLLVETDVGLAWARCVDATPLGLRWVNKLDVGDRSYLAGVDPRRRIATHNKVRP